MIVKRERAKKMLEYFEFIDTHPLWGLKTGGFQLLRNARLVLFGAEETEQEGEKYRYLSESG